MPRDANFDYDDEGDDYNLSDDSENSAEEANEDSESDFNSEDEEVTAHGKVVESEEEMDSDEMMDDAEEPPVDIQPAKVSKKKKAMKTKIIADGSPVPISKPKPKPKTKTVSSKSSPAGTTVSAASNKKMVDVSSHTVAKIFKATIKRENQVTGHILPQPSTATCRIDTNSKANAINQCLSDLISSKEVTRDNCVKVVSIVTKKGEKDKNAEFVYTFGVWSQDGRLVPFKTHHTMSLLTADLSSKGSSQTPKKWVTDKKNMMDAESYHVIKHGGVSYNVPMPITSSDHNASLTNEQNRTVRKNSKQKQTTIKFQKKKPAPVQEEDTPNTNPPVTEQEPQSPEKTSEKAPSPPKKRKRAEEEPKQEQPSAQEESARAWLKKMINTDGSQKRVCVDLGDAGVSWILTINAEKVDRF